MRLNAQSFASPSSLQLEKIRVTQTLKCSVYTKLGFGSHHVHVSRDSRASRYRRGVAERDAPNRLLSSCHTEEIEILTTQARGLKEEEEDSPKGSQFCVYLHSKGRKKGRKKRELSAVAMALAVPQIMSCGSLLLSSVGD